MAQKTFKEIIDVTFGLAKNCRLLATENRTEPQPGHVNWAEMQTPERVLGEIAGDIEKVEKNIDGNATDEAIRHAFGYAKNARLCFLEGRTEPQGGHVNWANGQRLSTVRDEIIRQLHLLKNQLSARSFIDDPSARFLIYNQSPFVVYVKGETSEDGDAFRMERIYHGKHDGIAIPEKMPGKVFKSVDNVDITIHEDGSISTSGGSFYQDLVQFIRGGWLSKRPEDDGGWKPIFDISGEKERAVREREDHERRIREDREIRAREYEERLERYERGERDPGEPPRRRDEFGDPF